MRGSLGAVVRRWLLLPALWMMDESTTVGHRTKRPRASSSVHPVLRKTYDHSMNDWVDIVPGDPRRPGTFIWSRFHWFLHQNGSDEAGMHDDVVELRRRPDTGSSAAAWDRDEASGRSAGSSAFTTVVEWAGFENFILR